MILFASVFSWISAFVSLLCLVWLVGLGVYVLVRSIILKVKTKKEIKKDLADYEKCKKRKFGTQDDE